jgi:hypothetical protein
MDGLLAEDPGTVLIAIDTDPNENVGLVADAVRDRGLEGLFAVTPQTMTDMLVQQFGPEIVTPPSAPIVLISPDQTSARLLPRGLKSAEDLAAALDAVR